MCAYFLIKHLCSTSSNFKLLMMQMDMDPHFGKCKWNLMNTHSTDLDRQTLDWYVGRWRLHRHPQAPSTFLSTRLWKTDKEAAVSLHVGNWASTKPSFVSNFKPPSISLSALSKLSPHVAPECATQQLFWLVVTTCSCGVYNVLPVVGEVHTCKNLLKHLLRLKREETCANVGKVSGS